MSEGNPLFPLAAELAVRLYAVRPHEAALLDYLVTPAAYTGLLDLEQLLTELEADYRARLELLADLRRVARC